MIKRICLLVMTGLITISITGCSSGTKYCSEDGCPRESLSDRSYCAEHKCDNFSCDNRATRSFGYCEECLERANN